MPERFRPVQEAGLRLFDVTVDRTMRNTPAPASPHQHHPNVVDVGAGGAGHHQIIQRGKEAVAVVGAQEGARVQLLIPRTCQRVGGDDGASSIFGAVDAVTVSRQCLDALLPGQGQRHGQQALGVAPALAGAIRSDGDGRFSP